MIFKANERVTVNGELATVLHAIDASNYAVTMVDTGQTCTAPVSTILPVGVETYRDVLGRQHHRAVGPNGTFLVTRARHTFEVWRSDSTNTVARDRDLRRALDHAVYYANAGH